MRPPASRDLPRVRRFHDAGLSCCVLCKQTVKKISLVAFVVYPTGDALLYCLCKPCSAQARRGFSPSQARILNFSVDLEAERLGILNPQGGMQ